MNEELKKYPVLFDWIELTDLLIMLHITKNTLKEWCSEGELKCSRIKNKTYFPAPGHRAFHVFTLSKLQAMNMDKTNAPAMYFWGTPNNYAVKPSPKCDLKNMPGFSIFRRPITNKYPYQVVNLIDVYNYIICSYAKDRTNEYRAIKDERYRRQYKADMFDYCTFFGIFSVRADKAIIQHSGYICLDFDHLNDVEAVFEALKEDPYFETLLLFRSPSGDGLKWVVSFTDSFFRYGNDGESFGEYQVRFFASLYNYIFNHYGVEVDRHCRNLSRACYLPHDAEAYLNPSLL